MSHPNHSFTALLLSGFLLGARAAASDAFPDAATPPASAPTLSVSLRAGETVNDHQVQRAYLTIGTNQIAFVLPTGFRMDASGGQKIVFSDSASRYFITVRVTGAVAPDADSQMAFFQDRALNRFPGANVSRQFSAFAAGHSGPAFDLAWVNSNGGAQSARIAFVPSPAGILEFSVLARTVDFGDAQSYLTVLMASVRSNETGKLVITPLRNNS